MSGLGASGSGYTPSCLGFTPFLPNSQKMTPCYRTPVKRLCQDNLSASFAVRLIPKRNHPRVFGKKETAPKPLSNRRNHLRHAEKQQVRRPRRGQFPVHPRVAGYRIQRRCRSIRDRVIPACAGLFSKRCDDKLYDQTIPALAGNTYDKNCLHPFAAEPSPLVREAPSGLRSCT